MLVRALAGGMRASVQGSCKPVVVVVQLTNAGLETRAARMHWRAGAAKERPASILRNMCICVSERVWEVVVVLICKQQKQQSPKQNVVRRQPAEAHRRDTESRLPRKPPVLSDCTANTPQFAYINVLCLGELTLLRGRL